MTLSRVACLLSCLSAGPALAAPGTFSIDERQSSASAHVGKTGLASFAGHEHVVQAKKLQGEVVFDAQSPAQSSVDLIIDTRALQVRAEGEPEGDAPKVQERMRAPDQLDVNGFRTIHFRSSVVLARQTAPGTWELSVSGELSLHGVSRTLIVPLTVELKGDLLVAAGKLTVKLTDFGIEPTGAAGGLVKVENEVPIDFRIAARATQQP